MLRCSRFSAFLALACLFLSFSHSAAFAANRAPSALPANVVQTIIKMHQKPGSALPELLQQHLQETGDLLSEAQAEDQLQLAGKANQLTYKQQMLESKRFEIADFRLQVEAELAQTRAKLAKLKVGDQLDAFDNYAAKVGQRFDSLNNALSKFSTAQKDGPRRLALSAAISNLNGLQSPSGVSAPNAIPSPTTRLAYPVKSTPVTPSKHLPRYLSALPTAPNAPSFASLLDLLVSSAQAAAPSTPSQASACSYTSADLAATEDVVINPAIQALAAQLNYSPVKIFQYVYNNIKYEPYFGSLKGSLGVMYSNAGGATDQSSLLIALLRASNIPARYVLGDIQVLDASNLGANGRAPLWIGAKNYQAAASILSTNLNPNAGVVTNSSSVQIGIQLRHVWVEACLPYGNYRGAATDNSGYRWLPMDPSFKLNSYQPGIANMQTNVPFNYSATSPGYLAARTNTLPFENYESLINTYLASNYPSNTLLDVPYLGTEIPRNLDILPITLPYEVVQYDDWNGTTSSEASALPSSHRYQFTVKVRDSSNNVLVPDQTLDTVNLVDQRVTLSYQPADRGSQTIWNAWNGDLTSLPSGTVNLTPILNINGVAQSISGSSSLKLGVSHNLVLEVTFGDTSLSQASCRNDNPTVSTLDTNLHCFNKVVYTNFVAGSYHALMAYAHQGSESLIAEHANQLIQTVQANSTPPTPASAANYDAVEGEFLHLSLLKYLNYVTAAGQTIGQLNGVSGESGVHLGVTGAGLLVNYLFDLPYTIQPSGPYIDVLGNLLHFVKLDTTAPTTAEIWPSFKLAAYSSSAYEHYIWQEMINTDAVSTVRGLQFASEPAQAIPLVTLTSANISSWSTLMDASMSGYQTNITSYVNQGATVTVPYKTIAYTDIDGTTQAKSWKGAIYMAENQTSGYIAAIINGGLGGGYSLLGSTSDATLTTTSDGFTAPVVVSTSTSDNTLGDQLHHLLERLKRLAKLGRRSGQSYYRQPLP